MRKSLKSVEYRQTRIKIDVFFFNFASSYYHHHYCYSNEQSFKSETLLSTLIENLLTLFAIVFTFCCQIIIMKLIFNSYQINLLSKISLFIYISNVSFSFIMSTTIRYMMFIFVSKFSKTLHFDKHNIIKFLEHFEKQCDEYKVIEKK